MFDIKRQTKENEKKQLHEASVVNREAFLTCLFFLALPWRKGNQNSNGSQEPYFLPIGYEGKKNKHGEHTCVGCKSVVTKHCVNMEGKKRGQGYSGT